jgi:hypothetical protein
MRRHGDFALPFLVRTGRRRPAKRAWNAASTEDRPGIRSTHYVLGTTWLEDERACYPSPGRLYPCLSVIGQHSPLFRGKKLAIVRRNSAAVGGLLHEFARKVHP